MEVNQTISNIIYSFWPQSTIVAIIPIENGLINSTFSVEVILNANRKKYILQKINTAVFHNPKAIQANISLVSAHLKAKGYPYPILELCATAKGKHEINVDGATWRMFVQIENCYTNGVVKSPKQSFAIGTFFGTFYHYLQDIDTQKVQLVLPHFLAINKRIEAFQKALNTASSERLAKAKKELNWLLAHQELPQKWIALQQQNKLPLRLIHADPKISNVLFDVVTHQPKAIIDWDTLMVGTILYDYGDMIRSYTNTKLEDDPDSEGIFNAEVYKALTDGFLAKVGPFLTPIELENIPYAPQVIVYIQALRFLTDYLNGDTYYSCSYPEQNLNRAKNQINLVQQILKL